MAPQTQRRSPLLIAGGIFGLAFGIRLTHLFQIESAPFWSMRLGDALSYDLWAKEIASGNIVGDTVFYQAPLYPYWLAAVYAFIGPDRWIVVLCQSLLSSVSCVMLFAGTSRLVSRRAGVAAGILLACYAPSIFFDSLIQKSSLDLFFLTLAIMLLGRWQTNHSTRIAVGLGAAIGCLILCRENAFVLVAAILIGKLFKARTDTSILKRHLVLFALGVTLVLLPVAIRNKTVGNEFHLTTSQFGPNFYIGNNATANGMYQPLVHGGGNAQYERQDATRLAEQYAGRSLNPSEVSGFWFRKTIQEIREQPRQWLSLMLRKAMLLLNHVEVTDTEDMYAYADWSWPLRILVPVSSFGFLIPLGIVGISVTQCRDDCLTLLLMIGSYALGLWLFYVMARYRFPLAPMLMIFGGAAIGGRLADYRALSIRSRCVTAIFVVVSVILCYWPILNVGRMKSVTYYNVAVEFDVNRQPEEAIPFYRKSLSLNPDDSDAHANLGEALLTVGRFSDAAVEFEAATRLTPTLPVPHFFLGRVYVQLNRPDDALREYKAAVLYDPSFADAYVNIGALQRHRREFSAAESAFRQALQCAPENGLAHANLANLLMETGSLTEAVRHFETALKLMPMNQPIREALNTLNARVAAERPDAGRVLSAPPADRSAEQPDE